MHTIKNNGCFSGIRSITMQMVQFKESVCSETERICWHMMTTGSSAAFDGNPPGTVLRAAAGVGAQHRGQPIGTVPVDPEPCQPSGTELSASQPGISNYNAVEQANIKAQFAARAGFPNVIGARACEQS